MTKQQLQIQSWVSENDIDRTTFESASIGGAIWLRGFSRKLNKYVGALKNINTLVPHGTNN